MNEKMEDLLYKAGLTASGCWDELGTYEQEAIEKLTELIVLECATLVENDGRFLRYTALAEKIRNIYGKSN
jgi:hypothetical protein